MSRSPPFELLIITDLRVPDDLVAAVERAVSAGPPGRLAVMLREKDLDGGPLLLLARRLREVTGKAGALLLVNDRVDVAMAAGADGVHLPSRGLRALQARRLLGDAAWVGVSTHDAAAVAEAEADGADYVTFGPVFDTPSKRPYGPPVGLDVLRRLSTRLPVIGLGGIDAVRAPDVVRAGAAGVACIRAVLGAPDPAAAVREFLTALRQRPPGHAPPDD